jgi:hypothetical protein
MVNRKLMEGDVGRLVEGGYSNAEGGTIAVRTPDAQVARMDTAGLDGIQTKTIVKQRPVAEVDYNISTTVNPDNFDNRPAQIAADNADAGSRGTADVEPDMIAGDETPVTYDARSAEETTTETVSTPVPAKTGLTETQKNIAWGIGLVVVAVGGYFVVKNYAKG